MSVVSPDRHLSATEALSLGYARNRIPNEPFNPTDAVGRLGLACGVVALLGQHAYDASILLGQSAAGAHERASSIIANQKTAEGRGVQDDVAVSGARAKVAYTVEEYVRALDAAIEASAKLGVGGVWAHQGIQTQATSGMPVAPVTTQTAQPPAQVTTPQLPAAPGLDNV